MGIISFFKKIRTENDEVRRRWLMVFTASSSLVVVAFWAVFANGFIPSIAEYDPKYKSEEVAVAEPKREFGVLETFSAGVGYVFKDTAKLTNKFVFAVGNSFVSAKNKLGDGIEELASVFSSFKSFTGGTKIIKIDKQGENFIVDDLAPLPERKLP